MRPLRAARVRVPCSTSNLGAGFDCVGLALDRHLEASFEPGGPDLRIERGGTLAALTTGADEDVLANAFRLALADRARDRPCGLLRMTSDIPIARGLGSSAAATVAGLSLGAAALGEECEPAALLGVAARLEGHADNVAPILAGGLVGVARDREDRPLHFRLPLSDELGFAWAAPPVEVSTARARRALPSSVAHAVAARAAARAIALVRGLATADAELLRAGFHDELHVPYRWPLIPGATLAVAAAQDAGAWAVTISGSGSGLIAVCRRGLETAVADAMGAAFRNAAADEPPRDEARVDLPSSGTGSHAASEGPSASRTVAGGAVVAFPVHPDRAGAQILTP